MMKENAPSKCLATGEPTSVSGVSTGCADGRPRQSRRRVALMASGQLEHFTWRDQCARESMSSHFPKSSQDADFVAHAFA